MSDEQMQQVETDGPPPQARTRRERGAVRAEFRAAGAFIRVLDAAPAEMRRAWVHYLMERYLREVP